MRNSTSIVHQCGNQFDCLLAYRNVGEGLACQARCRNPRHRDVQRQGHRFHRPTHQSKKPQSRCHCRVGACRLRLGPKTVRFIGGNGFNSPKLAEIAGEAADGTLVGSPWFLTKKDDVNQKFVEAYKGKYGEDPDQFAAQAYDTMYLVARAISAAGSTEPEKLRDALQKAKNVGVMGPFSFTEGRDPADTSGVVILEMQGGKFRIFGETS